MQQSRNIRLQSKAYKRSNLFIGKKIYTLGEKNLPILNLNEGNIISQCLSAKDGIYAASQKKEISLIWRYMNQCLTHRHYVERKNLTPIPFFHIENEINCCYRRHCHHHHFHYRNQLFQTSTCTLNQNPCPQNHSLHNHFL